MDLELALRKHQAGQLDVAANIYRQILASQPNHVNALHLLGVVAYQQQRHQQAIAWITKAIQLKPDAAPFHGNLGNALHAAGRYDEATRSYQAAIALDANFVDAHFNLANCYRQQKLWTLACDSYRRVLSIQSNHAKSWEGLGNTLLDRGDVDEGIISLRRAIEIEPNNPLFHYSYGLAIRLVGNRSESEKHLLLALDEVTRQQIDRVDAEAIPRCRSALGMHWLREGELARGFAEYEYRLQCSSGRVAERSQPPWDGAAKQRTILLVAEQGLGDTIQFIRYVPLLKPFFDRVIVECQSALIPLLQTAEGIDALVPQGGSAPADADVFAPLLSLPHLLQTSWNSLPAKIPYLSADAQRTQIWRERLMAVDGLRIGIAWQGAKALTTDLWRSMPLAAFAPIAAVPNARLISLQKGDGTEQLEQTALDVLDFGSFDEDGAFLDTAAMMHSLDGVITCDSAVAHLAGALGVPVFVGLPFVADWRWFTERSDSPWYPSATLFRQSRLGDWDTVFRSMRERIRAWPSPAR